MEITERIPRCFDANRKESVWVDIDSFIHSLETWVSVLVDVKNVSLEYDERWNEKYGFDVVLHNKDESKRHIAVIGFNKGDNRDALCNELIEKANGVLKTKTK